MASIKITLHPAEFSDLRARAGRLGIAFSILARMYFRAGKGSAYKALQGAEFPVTPPVNHKVKAGITLKIPANKRKTKGKT